MSFAFLRRSPRDGDWVCGGWSVARWLEGSHPDYSQPSTWMAIIEAGRAFHHMARGWLRP